MVPSEKPNTLQDYTILKTLFKNERNEIFLAKRNSDGLLKVLKQSVLHDENIVRASKLAHEFEILKKLNHQGIPKADEILYDGQKITLVQEYIAGSNIRNLVFNKKMNYSLVLKIGIQLAEVLYFLHQSDIIHKDINSGNIILADDGTVKIIDFGISSNINSETSEMLNIDRIEGTLTYISPEQTGRTTYSVTYSCDLYSFGILLYEMLSGKPPFDSVDPLEVVHFHLSRKPVPLRSILPDLPEGLDLVVTKLLAKNPDDRYNSAFGLKSDLQIISNHFENKKPLENFKAGLNDKNEQYKQSQKLYGRENEINELLEYYKNLNYLQSMLILVAGYSGVGKSSLIRHIKFPIIQNHGTFISGKFDQFKKDIPYYAFIEAIRDFIKNLLSEPEEKMNIWRNRILNVLGDNAGIITEVIPQLSKIIGQQTPVSKLQPAEQEARFHMVLIDFVYAFSTKQNPLVIFLDDLQWADLPSLNLVIRILENTKQNKILILGAYRDNEVEKGHPLLITLKQIENFRGQAKEIKLQPLDLETTCQITADSFGMNETKAKELGEHIFKKTKGNPFFIHSFLKSLSEKKLLTRETGKDWIWNQKKIDELGFTDNVIDLMAEGLSILTEQTQQVLKYAAVLGNTFNLTDLADITENSVNNTFMYLMPAIKGGYLSSVDKNYSGFALSSITGDFNIEKQLSVNQTKFSFSHDKVQQAAYNLISKEDLPSVHLRIGRLLLQNKKEAQLLEDIFELLNHFRISYQLINNESEKQRIIELCLIAGRKAKDSTSYSMGATFLTIAKKLLGKFSWTDNYQLTYNVLFELGECEYLNDNPEQAEIYFKEILGYSKTNFEKLQVYYAHSSLYLKMGNTNESLRLGLEAVKMYHIHFPKNKMAIQITALVTMLKYLVLFSTKYKNPENVFNLKDCTNEEIIALNKFLIDLATSAYQQDQNLMMLVIFRIIKLYLREGFTDASGWGFSGFSVVILSALKMQKKGFNLWDITKKLHQRTNSPLIKWRLSYTVLCFHNHWRMPIREGYNNILETIKACVLNGDQIFTGYTVALYLRSRFVAGETMNNLIGGSEDHLALIKNGKGGMDFFQCFYQLAKALNGQTKNNSWDDETFNGQETEVRLNLEGNKTKLAFFHSAKTYLLYYFEKYREAINESEVVLNYSDNFLGDVLEVTHAFYTSLSISAFYDELNTTEKRKYFKVFKNHLVNMKRIAKGSPQNFNAHYHLLQAEFYVLKKQNERALQFYLKSMQLANDNQVIYVEAIANERTAMLCSKMNLKQQKEKFIKNAVQIYKSWGAHIKCKQLETSFPELFSTVSYQNESQLSGISTVTSMSTKTALDLASVIKASQTIASQVKYVDLLKNLLHITIENAGAERACLVLDDGNQLCIEAVGISEKEDIEILSSIPVYESNLVPNSVINYCWRSEENVVINDAQVEERFNLDPYILKNKSQSIMCLPISAIGKLKGLLYLENNLLKGVFNRDRIELLQMLSGQIGISIENAALYENLEEKVQERTLEIEKAYIELKATQSQLIQAEKMASLGELTAGIAHEIQNPLNFVNNFAEVSVDLIDEMNEEFVQKNYADVQEIASDLKLNLEKINHHGKRASGIVKGMLQHSRTSTGQKELTDINALADEYLRLSYHGLRAKDKSFNSDFRTEFNESLPKIKIIPQDIGRVLLNLINNAFYAVNTPHPPEGGAENAETKYKPLVTVSTASYKSPSGDLGIKVVVKDNGPGIPSEIKDKIFQPFFTTKPTGQGTGLGLSLSYDIVKAHGGQITLESEKKIGTEFIITLPI